MGSDGSWGRRGGRRGGGVTTTCHITGTDGERGCRGQGEDKTSYQNKKLRGTQDPGLRSKAKWNRGGGEGKKKTGRRKRIGIPRRPDPKKTGR